jgi:hypothetical protein
MSTFDPTLAMMVHEQLHDVEVEWVPVTREEWTLKARWHDEAQTIVAWGEMLIDRWWVARDEDLHPD